MTKMTGSAHYAGTSRADPSDGQPSVRLTTLGNDRPANVRRSRKRARPLSRFLIALGAGVAATLAWWSYGEAARQMIAGWYPHLSWLAPQATAIAQGAPETSEPAAPAAPSFDQQLSDMSLDLDAVRQSIDRIAAGQEQMTRRIEQIATSIAAGQEQMTRSIEQIGIVAAGQEQMTRDIDQIATNIAAGQEQMTRSADQTAGNIAEAPSAEATGITVESQADGAALQPPVALNVESSEATSSQTPSQQTPSQRVRAAGGHDASCLSSASAVRHSHPGGWPSWTLRAPGHQGTVCWYAGARPGKAPAEVKQK